MLKSTTTFLGLLLLSSDIAATSHKAMVEDLRSTLEKIEQLQSSGCYYTSVNTAGIDRYLSMMTSKLNEDSLERADQDALQEMAELILSKHTFRDGSLRSKLLNYAQFQLVEILSQTKHGKRILENTALKYPLVNEYLQMLI